MGDARSFRKKPVVVQAIQWDGTLSGIDDILSVFSDIRTVAKTAHPSTNKCSFWKIGTLEGSREVSAGDFIIRGVKGEYYPCKPDIFTMTYEPADATPPADAALADRLCAIADSASINSEATQAELSPKQEQAIYDAAAALRARAVPEGFVMVPVEPTVAILAAHDSLPFSEISKPEKVWAAMLAASKAGGGG